MKKKERLEKILEIINAQEIGTHEELQKALEFIGIESTQSTLSRDIRALNLVKIKNKRNKTIYVQVSKEEEESRLRQAITLYALSVARVEFMLVVKTRLSTADILASLIDELNTQRILGTIAGADTLMITARSVEDAIHWEDRFLKIMAS
ncbi:MAG: arginine repressor [Streptococcaceae bacterium]|nr:arginine repressor [Streptococcaceae bacterium]